MSKPNAEQTEQEFQYTYALKRAMNDLLIVEEDVRQAKTIGIKGVSAGSVVLIEHQIRCLKDAIVNGLKTVGA